MKVKSPPSMNKYLFEKLLKKNRLNIQIMDTKDKFDISPTTSIYVKNPSAYKYFLKGEMAATESFIRGEWETNNLLDLMNQFVGKSFKGLPFLLLGLALNKTKNILTYWKNINSKTGSKKNIHYHYDLGNDFFSCFLDKTMNYSSGIYPSAESSLYEASMYKMAHICEKIGLKPGDRVLEIGSGWGALSRYIAKNYSCEITATTISKMQYSYAKEKIAEEGLHDKIDLLYKDYRELNGKYDVIISIEMIEAVGEKFLPEYFQTINNCLTNKGKAFLQAILMNEQRVDTYRKSIDFIQKHIFPGSFLPTISLISKSIKSYTDLQWIGLEDITPHYAKTLHDWKVNFKEKINEVRSLGYTEELIRMWLYYLNYCEAGFSQNYIQDVQILFQKNEFKN